MRKDNVQQARPTTEQAREKIYSYITKLAANWDAFNEGGGVPITYDQATDQILRLLPFPDEQAKEMITRQLPKFEQDVRESERNRIKDLICFNGFLVNTERHGHGYLIPDDLWDKLFPRGSLKAGEPPQGGVQ